MEPMEIDDSSPESVQIKETPTVEPKKNAIPKSAPTPTPVEQKEIEELNRPTEPVEPPQDRPRSVPTISEPEITPLHCQVEEKMNSPDSGKTTPHPENAGSVKRTPPSQPDLPSMGVYTPDSTTNSVHSLHYGQCDLDVSQLGLESPTSIASDLASQNSVERPPSALPSMPPAVSATISTSMPMSATPSSVSINIPNQVSCHQIYPNYEFEHLDFLFCKTDSNRLLSL